MFDFLKNKLKMESEGWWLNLEKAKNRKIISEKEYFEFAIKRIRKELANLEKKK